MTGQRRQHRLAVVAADEAIEQAPPINAEQIREHPADLNAMKIPQLVHAVRHRAALTEQLARMPIDGS